MSFDEKTQIIKAHHFGIYDLATHPYFSPNAQGKFTGSGLRK
jgi:hypothetical protein